jgi:hypothetical protein
MSRNTKIAAVAGRLPTKPFPANRRRAKKMSAPAPSRSASTVYAEHPFLRAQVDAQRSVESGAATGKGGGEISFAKG